VITGTELARPTDAEVVERLPDLHAFGRVAPEDEVRLARLMQQAGHVVAMTGEAVNDAAALKQADSAGVGTGSGRSLLFLDELWAAASDVISAGRTCGPEDRDEARHEGDQEDLAQQCLHDGQRPPQ
jgi:magnesium-transporting ATPase (P-type)